ncbi:MAG: hypothetical protein ACE37F_07790 [Nannocystaceae bacterium]|nr:hypothetical protein [bacterium]
MFDPRRFLACLLLSSAPVACDSDESDTGEDTMNGSGGQMTTDPTGDSGSPDEGRCAPDMAIVTCDAGDCAFDPAEVDCAAACANIAALCASNECDAQCSGLESDASTCAAACEGTKNLMCSNVVFGCYTSNSGCDDVGACVDVNT